MKSTLPYQHVEMCSNDIESYIDKSHERANRAFSLLFRSVHELKHRINSSENPISREDAMIALKDIINEASAIIRS